MDIKIRKQVYELTLDDLSSSPVWEFALDEEGAADQDEATVRPYPFVGTLDPSVGMLIVAAQFWLADGTRLGGYLTPPPPDDLSLGSIQPQIVTNGGQVIFWCGRCQPNPAHAYQILGREASAVFPIRFESIVPLIGGKVSGNLPGFLCLENDFVTVKVVL